MFTELSEGKAGKRLSTKNGQLWQHPREWGSGGIEQVPPKPGEAWMSGREMPEAAAAPTKGRWGNPGPGLPGVIGVLGDLGMLDSASSLPLLSPPRGTSSDCHL